MGESEAIHTQPWTSSDTWGSSFTLKLSVKCCMRWVQSWKSFLRARKQNRPWPEGWPLGSEQSSHSSCRWSFKYYFFLPVFLKAKWLDDCVKRWLKTHNSYPTTKNSTQVTAMRGCLTHCFCNSIDFSLLVAKFPSFNWRFPLSCLWPDLLYSLIMIGLYTKF